MPGKSCKGGDPVSFLGLDIGTSGCKASIIDVSGNCLAQAYREYPLISLQPGWQEIDPERVWQSVRQVIAKALAGCPADPIRAVSVSSFGEAVIAIDRDGNPLCNSMIYIDCRGRQEADDLEYRLGSGKVLGITGTTILPLYSICKIMWLKKNLPELYRKTWKFLLFADFILFKLGAGAFTDYSLATRTMAFDIIKKQWSTEILDCAGIDKEKFGEPVQSGTVIGQVSRAAAADLGLPANALLVAGGHDQPCAALGAGVIRSGLAVDGLGTTECITPAFDHPILSDAMAQNYFACVPHVVPDMYVTYAFTFTSGSVLKWYRDNWGRYYQDEAARLGVNVYDLMIDRAINIPAAAEAAPVFVLPHFAGAATPYMDTAAQGAIIGLNINTRPEAIIRGILEGMTFEIMVNVERLALAGVTVDELVAVGGLARSDAFLQLKADMMGKKVTTLHVSEAGTLGVAILAGTACGVYKDLDDAVEKLVRKKIVFYPDDRLHDQYLEKFETYKRMYPAVNSILHSPVK